MTTKKKWKKVLYENQGFPDNYTDKELFLRDLKTNIDLKEFTLNEAFRGASILIQEFCTVTGFVLIYFYMVNDWIEPEIVLKLTSVLAVFGFLFHLILFGEKIREKLGHDVRVVLTFVVFGQLFSPVMHTLTDTISTDTIYTMVFLGLFVHLVFFDYGVSAAIVSKSLSLSAAVFASICLASRLPSAQQAFILMTVATVSFVLFPLFRKEFNNSQLFTIVLLILNIYFLSIKSILFTFIFLSTVGFIGLFCPILFVRYQKYRENIYGPWDEAIVDDADNLIFLNE